jgi:hypothetical protein
MSLKKQVFLRLIKHLKTQTGFTSIYQFLIENYKEDRNLAEHFYNLLIGNSLAEKHTDKFVLRLNDKGKDLKERDYKWLFEKGTLDKPKYFSKDWIIEKVIENAIGFAVGGILGFLVGKYL